MRSFHIAVQVDSALWAVTFLSELGFNETRIMTSVEFVEMISAEAHLGCWFRDGRIDDIRHR